MIATVEPEPLVGLSGDVVRERLASEGYNELPQSKKKGFLGIALGVLKEPMFLLLLACGGLYLLVGDAEEALMLLGFVFVVMGITFWQENKTERALDALRDLSSPRALVIRDGVQERIAGREVVRDDIILVSEGDRIPADALVLRSDNLVVDESLLTGESVPVRKRRFSVERTDGSSEDLSGSAPGGDELPTLWSGTMAVKGRGVARVVATGSRTAIGRIGKALQRLETEATNLQKQTGRIVRTFGLVGALLCVAVVVIFGLTRQDWLHGFLAGLSLAMATLPEEFPVVMTIFLALGAWRISKRKVLTRRMAAIEMLGAATVLCTDKTGTITMNRMTVARLGRDGDFRELAEGQSSLPESLHDIVEYAVLASPADPFDPMERAMREVASRTLAGTEHVHRDWRFLREYPLSDGLLAMSHAWESVDRERLVIAAKGAPEAIADLCHLDEASVASLRSDVDGLAAEGLRVIGVAAADFPPGELPESQHDFAFRFVGLMGLRDPVRPGVPAAVAQCRSAGIRVVMITGDYPGTARNIAREIGLADPEAVMTGPELQAMDDEELARRISGISVFARAVPEHKLRIVAALKARGEIVAMTGDGVNDAPALKASHIGVAMGGRGTDVARESAALVLLDDDFSSIVAAARVGRRIYDNLRKAMTFIFSVHLPIAGMSMLPVMFGMPLALMPVHILFLELIIDPACSIVFEMEEEERGIMERPPRPVSEPLFGRRMILIGLVQGLGVLALVAIIYSVALGAGLGEGEARAMAFVNLVFGNLCMIISNRSWTRSFLAILKRPNPALGWVVGGALAFLALVVFVPFLNRVFGFAPLHPWELGLCVLTGLLSIAINEAAKLPGLLRARGGPGMEKGRHHRGRQIEKSRLR
ncbi:MAG TPA: cation-translocating P-type ATPase [Rectinemataceae bacterium]|nr:cation-translocating P-type ATPase [Rectinemataceae bacterium]